MKKMTVFCLLFMTMMMANAEVTNKITNGANPSPYAIQGGVMEYVGTVGPYNVEFSYMNLHMGDGAHFQYRYTSVTVNKGNWIELRYVRQKGKYQVWKEYINGKNTGTFTILWNAKEIKGTFVNSKGKASRFMPNRVAEIGLMPVIPRFEVNNRVLNTTNMDFNQNN